MPGVFHCGSWSMHWLGLSTMLQFYVTKLPVLLQDPNYSTGKTRQTWSARLSLISIFWLRDAYRNGDKWTLIRLLDNFSGSLAARGRDHLFALRALASDADDNAFDPDYEEPLVSVVCRYGAALVRLGYGQSLVMGAGVVPGAPAAFPSWIPDWTDPREGSGLLGVGNPAEPLYSASGDTELALSLEP
jgi:hypothetical protein